MWRRKEGHAVAPALALLGARRRERVGGRKGGGGEQRLVTLETERVPEGEGEGHWSRAGEENGVANLPQVVGQNGDTICLSRPPGTAERLGTRGNDCASGT